MIPPRSILLVVTLLGFAVHQTRATETASIVDNHKSKSSPTPTPSTSVFFATPPASLSVPADFTAQPFFVTDLLKAFYSGFGPSQTSVEPQPLITDPVVSRV